MLAYCQQARAGVEGPSYDGEPVRVIIDDRDIRGGEKNWQHIKRGVPLRLEIGPRDMPADAVFMARRDKPPNEKTGVPRSEFVATIETLLTEIQDTLFRRAGTSHRQHAHHRQPRRFCRILHAQERGQAGDPRRIRSAHWPRTRR